MSLVDNHNNFSKIQKNLNEGKESQEKQTADTDSLDARLTKAWSKMSPDLKETFFSDYPRKTEICKDFKIRDIWNKVTTKPDEGFDFFREEEFYQYEISKYICNQLHLNPDDLDQSDTREVLLNRIKDESLKYINANGALPTNMFPQGLMMKYNHCGILGLFRWLGLDRARQITKLNFNLGDAPKVSLRNLNYLCPNIRELVIESLNFHKYELQDFKNISKFPSLKKLKLSYFDLRFLTSYLSILSYCKLQENFELELEFNSDLDGWSIDECLTSYENVRSIDGITKLTISNSHPDSFSASMIHEYCKLIFLRFVNVNELEVCNLDVESIIAANNLKKLKNLSFTNRAGIFDPDVLINALCCLPQITHLSLSNCSNIQKYIEKIRGSLPNLESLSLNGKKIELSKNEIVSVEETFNPPFASKSLLTENTSLAPKITQGIFGASLLSLGIYSLMKAVVVSPTPVSQKISPFYRKVGMIAAGALTVLASVSAYYKFSNVKSKGPVRKSSQNRNHGSNSIKNMLGRFS